VVLLAVTAAHGARVDRDALAAYLDWHCSADNVWRYEGPLTLAAAPTGLASDDRAALWPVLEIGPGPLPDATAVGEYRSLAIDAAVPSADVSAVLDALARGLAPGDRRWVALALPDTFAPRPPPPWPDAVEAARAELLPLARATPGGLGPLVVVDRDPCNQPLLHHYPCAQVAEVLADELARHRCRDRAPELLARFSVDRERGVTGQPVALIRVGRDGEDHVATEGAWAASGPAFLASAHPAMAAVTVPLEARGVHHAELEMKKWVQPDYPREAKGLGDVKCVATVRIDAFGVPEEVTVASDCPTVLQPIVRDAILEWRWYPPKDGKQRVAAEATIAVQFVAR
jgi:hypothetical protein